MQVASIYEPVQEGLDQVEATLDALTRSDIPGVQAMLEHTLAVKGKRLRPTIALLAGRFGEHRLERLVPLAASIELLHTATLVHDDVIDESDTRRGRETTNARFNNARAVMLGDYMFAHAANLVCRTESLDVVRLFSRTLMAMAAGELTQDMSAYQYSQGTMQYFQRIAGKTASLFAASTEGGALIAGAEAPETEALRCYGECVGMAFQILDDILDFEGDEAELGKPAGSDLMEGTLTLPSLLFMERHPNDNPIKKLFEDGARSRHLAEALAVVRESDVLDDSYAVARDFRDRAVEALNALPDTPDRAAMIEVAGFVVQRRS